MVDVWLIIITVVIAIIMLAFDIYILALYCHPDDFNFWAGWISKIVVIAASIIIWGFVLVLPLDIANARGQGSGFNMDLLYEIMFILYFVFVVFILPLTM